MIVRVAPKSKVINNNFLTALSYQATNKNGSIMDINKLIIEDVLLVFKGKEISIMDYVKVLDDDRNKISVLIDGNFFSKRYKTFFKLKFVYHYKNSSEQKTFSDKLTFVPPFVPFTKEQKAKRRKNKRRK